MAVNEPCRDLIVLDIDYNQFIAEFLVMKEQRQVPLGYEFIENAVDIHQLPRRYQVFAGLEHPQILAASGTDTAFVNKAPLVDIYSHISSSFGMIGKGTAGCALEIHRSSRGAMLKPRIIPFL
jgi:hypothetical protein